MGQEIRIEAAQLSCSELELSQFGNISRHKTPEISASIAEVQNNRVSLEVLRNIKLIQALKTGGLNRLAKVRAVTKIYKMIERLFFWEWLNKLTICSIKMR